MKPLIQHTSFGVIILPADKKRTLSATRLRSQNFYISRYKISMIKFGLNRKLL